MKVTNIRKNIMGTISFDGRFEQMRKAQDFIVYPLADSGTVITVQSDTRFGRIDLFNGLVTMSQPHAGGAYSHHLLMDKPVYSMIAAEECQLLRDCVKRTGGLQVGSSIVKSDNTGAMAL